VSALIARPGTVDPGARTLGGLVAACAVALMVMPVFSTFGELLTNAALATGLDAALGSWIAPVEARLVHGALTLFGLRAYPDGSLLSVTDGARATTIYISWNCVGWQTVAFLALSLTTGLQGDYTWRSRTEAAVLGILGVLLLNVGRITVVALVAFQFGPRPAAIVHDYGSVLLTVAFLFAFWSFAYNAILEPRVTGS
jgi:exosortase/archaeosortase family protein